MIEHTRSAARWEERIGRAHTLVDEHPTAAEPLTFYAALAAFQKSLARAPQIPTSGTVPTTIDLDRVVDAIPAFLAWLPTAAPARLIESVSHVRARDRRAWKNDLQAYFDAAGDIADAGGAVLFVVEAILQPFAETIATTLTLAPGGATIGPSRCPACGTLPVVAVLREAGHGAKRSLLCGLCFTEWECLRMRCASCDNDQFERLPIYTAEQFPFVRIDACDSCRRYIKTIDLTKNGLAVPPVDDIATLSLDLWATEQGYRRVKRNILGL
jgi:FdhE protein